MFSPVRLLSLGILAFAVYMGFYAVPSGGAGAAGFDPAAVAQYEALAWQAGRERQEWPAFTNSAMYQRELHRLSWFRAGQTGFTLSRALVQFPHMTARYDRILPGLEEIARIEKGWTKAEYDHQVVARQQLNWLTSVRSTRQGNDTERAVSEMSEELGKRFGLRPDQTYGAASQRAEAYRMMLARAEPDWEAVTLLLEGAYGSLKAALDQARPSDF